MKKLFVICLLLVCSMANLSAQTVTKNTLPKNLQGVHMNFEVDFSQAMILGKTETEYAEYEKDWNKDKGTIIRNFRVATNLAIGKSYKVGEYKDATYIIKVKVNTITDDGFMYCHVDIVNKDKVVCLSIEDLTGGKEPAFSIGTKLSRMKIWATLTGKKLGSILKTEMSDKNK